MKLKVIVLEVEGRVSIYMDKIPLKRNNTVMELAV